MTFRIRVSSASVAIFLFACCANWSAQAAISNLTTTASGSTVHDATSTAKRLIAIQCDLMFGTLLGKMEISDVVEDEEEDLFYLTARQTCNH
ncbi:hypothetical protein ABRP17_011925 [Stenotrophomonas sp. WHRI 8082]|uniref:hypothetical protein n=1 Tax=Stenotrophomonas sp. WHRI 8082 TaxID=3162571 RepID=UPI0032EE0BB8